jgi:hypothetical protein
LGPGRRAPLLGAREARLSETDMQDPPTSSPGPEPPADDAPRSVAATDAAAARRRPRSSSPGRRAQGARLPLALRRARPGRHRLCRRARGRGSTSQGPRRPMPRQDPRPARPGPGRLLLPGSRFRLPDRPLVYAPRRDLPRRRAAGPRGDGPLPRRGDRRSELDSAREGRGLGARGAGADREGLAAHLLRGARPRPWVRPTWARWRAAWAIGRR